MMRWKSLGPLWSGYLGEIVVVDAFNANDGASWTARGMQLGRGPSPHTIIVSSIDEAKAAAENYVAAWMKGGGVTFPPSESDIQSIAEDIVDALDDPNFDFGIREVSIVADLLTRKLIKVGEAA